jgi:3'-5' exoribonuclease
MSGEFAVRGKNLRPFRNKPGRYLTLHLADEVGREITARMWENAEKAAEGFNVGDVVSIRGQVEEYEQRLQIKITSLERCASDRMEKFIPSLDEETLRQLAGRFKELASSVKDRHLRSLLEKVFEDEETWKCFSTATAARSLHSAHVGGLLEHTVRVATLCESVCALYPEINRDLLLTAALIHDIGKLDSYRLQGAAFEQTEPSKLLGEPVLSERRLTAAVRELPDFPPDCHMLLSHLVLSHHGQPEFGAPVRPSCLEALVLHHVDNLEAKTNGAISVMKRETDPEKVWSEFTRLVDGSIYLPRLQTEEESEGNE